MCLNPAGNQPVGRFLIPIRLRSTNADLDELVCAQPTEWTFHPDIKWVIGHVHSRLAPLPNEFAKEIGNKGLWTPKP